MSLWETIRKRLLGGNAEAEPNTNLGARLNEAYILIQSREYENARRILLAIVDSQESIRDTATHNWIIDSLAVTWLSQEQFSEQIKFASDYLSRYPDDYLGYRTRAEAFWYDGQLSQAIRDYSRAIELNATDILSRSGRGQVLAELGHSADAIRDLDLALQLLDTLRNTDQTRDEWCRDIEAFVRRGRGVALAVSGQTGDAINEFTRSATLNPDNAWVYYSRARIYDQQTDRQQALADYSTAIAKSEPALTPTQKELARTRINLLSH